MPPINETTPPDPSAGAGEPSIDEFDAALAESMAEEAAPAHEAAASQPPADMPDTDGSPAPAPAVAADAPAADAKAPPAGSPSDDLLAKLPDDVRKAIETERRDQELRFKSVQGRLSASDRELARLRQAPGHSAAPAPTPTQDRAQEQQPRADEPDSHKQLREDYPEIAGPLLDVIDGLRNEVVTLKNGVGEVQSQRTEAAYANEQAYLDQQAPDWKQVLADERFEGWLQEQPAAVQKILEDNRDQMRSGKDAVWLVEQARRGLGLGGTSSPTPTPTPASSATRQRQLANGRDFGRSAPPVVSDIPDDFDGALDAMYAREEARQRQNATG